MTKRFILIALFLAFLASEVSAQYHRNRRRGVILGGLAGAAIGAAIGDKGDNETAGALIGGAVGAIAGGTIGNQRDQIIDQNRRYHSPYSHGIRPAYHGSGPVPHYYRPHVYEQAPIVHEPGPVVISPPPASTTISPPASIPSTMVTKQDVLKMIDSGMSDAIVIRQLEINGMDRALSVAEVIDLHQRGVSEEVITAMQLAGPDADSRIRVTNPSPSESTRSATERVYGPSVLPPPPPRPQVP
jgi:hypothetical protein